MRKNFFKKISAVALSLTMVVGMVGTVPAAVKTGTDISNGVKWQAFSIHTREDGGKWEDELKKDGQVYNTLSRAMAKMLSLLQLQQTEMHYLTLQVQVIVLSGHQWEL